MVIRGQKTLRQILVIDDLSPLKEHVLNERGRLDGAGVALTALAVGNPNAGAFL